MNLKESFEQWKKGKFVHKYPDEPETLGGMGVMRDGEWVQPWVVYMAKNLLEFAKANWDKIILSTCAIITAVVTVFAMQPSEPKKYAILPLTVNEQHTDRKTVEPRKNNHQNIIQQHNQPKPKENMT